MDWISYLVIGLFVLFVVALVITIIVGVRGSRSKYVAIVLALLGCCFLLALISNGIAYQITKLFNLYHIQEKVESICIGVVYVAGMVIFSLVERYLRKKDKAIYELQESVSKWEEKASFLENEVNFYKSKYDCLLDKYEEASKQTVDKGK